MLTAEEQERRDHKMLKVMMGLAVGMMVLCALVLYHIIKH